MIGYTIRQRCWTAIDLLISVAAPVPRSADHPDGLRVKFIAGYHKVVLTTVPRDTTEAQKALSGTSTSGEDILALQLLGVSMVARCHCGRRLNAGNYYMASEFLRHAGVLVSMKL